MKQLNQSRRLLYIAAFACVISPAVANADINGFQDFSNFSINVNDSGPSPSVSIPNDEITLLNGVSERRSIFNNSIQNISQFSASFVFQSTNTDGGGCFVLANSPSAVGGFNDGYSGIANSLAISLDNNDTTSLFTNGNVPNPPGFDGTPVGSVNLFSGDPIDVSLFYNGSILTEGLLDTTTSASFSTSYPINAATILGSSNAFVGLSGGSGIFSGSSESFSDLEFTTSVPEPASFGLLAFGTVAALLRRRVR